MKRILTTLVLIAAQSIAFSQIAKDTNCIEEVKTVLLAPLETRMGDAFNDNGGAFTITFDILDPQPSHLRYRIRHCNADWVPDDLDAGESSSNEVYFIFAKKSSENEKHFISTRGMEKTEIERY